MKKLLVLLLLVSAFGCEDDPMRRARQAHAAENADIAEAAFNEVLASDPNNFEAKRLLADVHRFRGDYERAEKELSTLWTQKKFDASGELTTEDKVAKRHMMEQFDRLYLAWVESIDATKKPELFQSVAQKGLERTPKSPTLNRKLVEFYFSRGDALVDENKKLEAAKMYQKVLRLIALPKQRADAQARSKKLRSEVFTESFQKKFDTEVLPTLKEAGQWEPSKKAVLFEIKHSVDRKLNPKKEADVDVAKQEANIVLQNQIADMIGNLAGLEKKIPRAGLPKYKVTSEKFKRGKYELSAELALDQMITAGFAFEEYLQRQKNKKPAKTPAETEDPKTEEKPSDD